ncbi:MAG TPA: alpha-amylase family glycosyl hydrolase, partial [Thermoanaerobaculia bacterium]|nr:alpha-amylase family glycosyl hydrolase [Thermoanaerobaculia bacterium]
MARRRTIGAELVDDGTSFRVWAPSRSRVAVVIGRDELALDREEDGYFSKTIDGVRAGTRYRFRLDDERDAFPDPASRFQPYAPHGASVVVDPHAFRWSDARWRGASLDGRVIYEMHVGTFTQDGTFAAATDCLHSIAELGANVIEVMPVNEFAGRFGWGYDGVDPWAPSHLYGKPDGFRRLVDTAHSLGLAVILDVVYNHFGPYGCYMSKYASQYFTKKYTTAWGDAINFDDAGATGVREFFAENAAYWIDEF